MTKTEYASYLQSPAWKELREQALEQAAHCCARCSLPRWLAELIYDQDLHVHHTSYAKLGKDNELDNLEVLCRRCHEIETFGRSELRAPKTATCVICAATHWDYRSNFCELCSWLCGLERCLTEKLLFCNPVHTDKSNCPEPLWKTVARDLQRMASYGKIDAEELAIEVGPRKNRPRRA